MAGKNRQILLAAYPVGMPKENDFRLVETDMPTARDGEFLVRINYLSVDPYLRGIIRGRRTGEGSVEIGQLMPGRAVGTIVESKKRGYGAGKTVASEWGWQEYAVSDGKDVRKVDTSVAPMPAWLGVLGMPGVTAYFGLLEIGKPKKGESVFVSGAAGAVGSTVGQIAKIKGCRAAGSAGSNEKVEWLTKELGFDAAFNYHEAGDLAAKVAEVAPGGVDLYYDNVGGPVTDAVFTKLRTGARVVICGQIDQYNAEDVPQGPRLLWRLLVKRARAQGFMVFQFGKRWNEAIAQISKWLKSGKLKHRESIVEGLENAPKAFIGLFEGRNIGKQVVKVAGEE